MACGDDTALGEGSGAGSGAGEEATSSLWWLGVLMSILASIASNLGVNIQKFSMMQEARRGPGRQRAYVAQPVWLAGLLLVIGGSVGDFAALGFAAQSLITPVGGFTMVANVIFAHFWLGEHLSRLDLTGTAAVILGVVLIAAFASKKESCYDLDELIDLYGHTSFLVYAVAVCSASIGLYVASKYFERLHTRHGASSREYKQVRRAHQFIYPTLSGVLGAQSVLFAKSTAELLKSAFRASDGDEPSPFASPMTYVIIVCMFSTIFMQLHWLAVALQWFDAVYCIPVFQCFFIMVTIFGGALYFQELSSFGVVQSIMFSVGVLVTLAGIVLLSQRQAKQSPRGRLRTAVHAVRFVIRVRRAACKTKSHRSLAKAATLSPARAVNGAGAPHVAPFASAHQQRDAKASYASGSGGSAFSFDRIPHSSSLTRAASSGRGLTAMVHDSDAQSDGGCGAGRADTGQGTESGGRTAAQHVSSPALGSGGRSGAALGSHHAAPHSAVDPGRRTAGERVDAGSGRTPRFEGDDVARNGASRDTLSPLPSSPPPSGGSSAGALGGAAMINHTNSTHAPLPSGVALAEGLVSVASFMLPASVHNLLKLATSTRGVTSRTRVRAMPGRVVHADGAGMVDAVPRRVSAPSLFAQPRQALSSAMVHSNHDLGLELGLRSPHTHQAGQGVPLRDRHHSHASSQHNQRAIGALPLHTPPSGAASGGWEAPVGLGVPGAGGGGSGRSASSAGHIPPRRCGTPDSGTVVVSGASGGIARLGSWSSGRRRGDLAVNEPAGGAGRGNSLPAHHQHVTAGSDSEPAGDGADHATATARVGPAAAASASVVGAAGVQAHVASAARPHRHAQLPGTVGMARARARTEGSSTSGQG